MICSCVYGTNSAGNEVHCYVYIQIMKKLFYDGSLITRLKKWRFESFKQRGIVYRVVGVPGVTGVAKVAGVAGVAGVSGVV